MIISLNIHYIGVDDLDLDLFEGQYVVPEGMAYNSYLIDDEKIYEYLWDGTQYPKFIRNTVDLQNSNSLYKDSDQSSLNFSQSLSKRLTYGKPDYTYVIIKNIIHTSTRRSGDYTHSIQYGDKKVMLTKGGVPFNKTMIHNFWQNKGEKSGKKN